MPSTLHMTLYDLQYLLHHLLALSRWIDERVWHRSHVTAVAWALLQDSYHTPLCLRCQPNLVATAVLYLTLNCCKVEIPGSRKAERQWWQVLCPSAEEKDLQAIAKDIMAVIDAAAGSSPKEDSNTTSCTPSRSTGNDSSSDKPSESTTR